MVFGWSSNIISSLYLSLSPSSFLKTLFLVFPIIFIFNTIFLTNALAWDFEESSSDQKKRESGIDPSLEKNIDDLMKLRKKRLKAVNKMLKLLGQSKGDKEPDETWEENKKAPPEKWESKREGRSKWKEKRQRSTQNQDTQSEKRAKRKTRREFEEEEEFPDLMPLVDERAPLHQKMVAQSRYYYQKAERELGQTKTILIAVFVVLPLLIFFLRIAYKIISLLFFSGSSPRFRPGELSLVDQMNQLALKLLKKKKYLRAAKLYKKIGNLHKAAECFEKSGALAEAVTLYGKTYPVRAAQICANIDLWDDAAQYYLLADMPEKAAEHIIKGGNRLKAARILEDNNIFDKAADLYMQIGNSNRAADLYLRSGNLEKAGGIYQELAKDPEFIRHCDKPGLAKIFEQLGHKSQAAYFYQLTGNIIKSTILYLECGKREEARLIYSQNKIKAGQLLSEYLVNNPGKKDAIQTIMEECQDFKGLAKLKESQGEYLQAADFAKKGGDNLFAGEMYEIAGKMDLAARAYEKAKSYSRAAELWELLQKPERAAEINIRQSHVTSPDIEVGASTTTKHKLMTEKFETEKKDSSFGTLTLELEDED